MARGARRGVASVAVIATFVTFALAARAQDTLTPAEAPISAADSAAPGGNTSAAGVATKQGQAVNPVGTPGTIAVARGVALTFTYIGEAAGNPAGGIEHGSAYSDQIFGGLDFDLSAVIPPSLFR